MLLNGATAEITIPAHNSPNKATSDEPTNGEISSGSSSAEYEFMLFPKLPLELREKIWEEVESTRRIIFVSLAQDTGLTARAHSPVPALLHTSSESRRISLNSYKLLHGNIPIHVDLSIDVLGFRKYQEFENFMLFTANKTKPRILPCSQGTVLTISDMASSLKHLAIFSNGWTQTERLLGLEALETYTVAASRIIGGMWYDGAFCKVDDARFVWERMWKKSKEAKAPQFLATWVEDLQDGVAKSWFTLWNLHLSKSTESLWLWKLKELLEVWDRSNSREL